ncbi:MAG: hypothetical protein ABSE49_36305, partial [Polyangiaceae bacterium]
ASTDVAQTDAENDAGGNGDAGAGASTLLLLGLASGGAFGSAFHGAAWDPVTRVATEDSYASGGGLAAAPDGRAFAAFRAEASPLLYDVIWDGSWPAPGALGVGNDDCVSAPATTAQSVFVVAAESPSANSPGGVFLDTYDIPSPSWTDDVPVGLPGAYARPAVAATAAGEPLVVIAQSANMQGYQWTLRSGVTWSTPAALPGISASADYQFDFPVLAKRVGVDQIVGVFETTVDDMSGASLGASVFSGGAWGMPTTVATSARTGEPPSLTALADGRVALAYTSATSAKIDVGFFDGTSWSAFAAVPGIAPSPFFAPAIAGGIAGDVLELVYIDANEALQHVRLTNEAAWTWSAPVLVDSANAYAEVYLASL